MSFRSYLLADYPPAVTAVTCSTLFALFLLGNATYYSFEPAPDHSMATPDYNRLLHNVSNTSYCQHDLPSLDTTGFRSVNLFTAIDGTEGIVSPDAIHRITHQSPAKGTYIITTDGRFKHPACEKGRCRVKKCVNILAPAEFFPLYNLSSSAQCEMWSDPDETYITFNLTQCNDSVPGQLQLLPKRVNEYAAPLSDKRRHVLVSRLLEIGCSLLLFNACLFLVALWNGVSYHRLSVWDLFQGDSSTHSII